MESWSELAKNVPSSARGIEHGAYALKNRLSTPWPSGLRFSYVVSDFPYPFRFTGKNNFSCACTGGSTQLYTFAIKHYLNSSIVWRSYGNSKLRIQKSKQRSYVSHFILTYLFCVVLVRGQKFGSGTGWPSHETDNWLYFFCFHEFWKCEKTKNTVLLGIKF